MPEDLKIVPDDEDFAIVESNPAYRANTDAEKISPRPDPKFIRTKGQNIPSVYVLTTNDDENSEAKIYLTREDAEATLQTWCRQKML